MNKSELIEAIAKSADISKASAEKALDGALGAIKGALKKGSSVTLVGFGTSTQSRCKTTRLLATKANGLFTS